MTQQSTKLFQPAPRLTWFGFGPVDGVTPLTGSVVVGREPGACDVLLESDLISRRHARVEAGAGGRVEIVDLDSSNGTFVNGRRVGRVLLSDGDRIGFGTAGETHCIFRAAPPAAEDVGGPAPGEAEAATAILSGELPRCPECSRIVTSALGTCRYCSAGRPRPSGDAAGSAGRAAVCAACGTPAREGGSFCHRCGSRLTG